VNILNNSRTADKGWFSNLIAVQEVRLVEGGIIRGNIFKKKLMSLKQTVRTKI
jgi:hypothetical protein